MTVVVKCLNLPAFMVKYGHQRLCREKCQLCESKEFVVLCQCFQMKLCSMTVGHTVGRGNGQFMREVGRMMTSVVAGRGE